MARYLALDWDQNQLHVIAADVRGSAVRVQRAAVWQEAKNPNPAEAEQLGQLLRDRLKEMGVTPAPVLACVGRDRVIVKDVRFPPVPESEEPALVRFQTVKELTDAVDDVILDYVVSGSGSNGERRASALVIRREVLTTYQQICQAAGLKLQALTPRMVGVAACVRQVIGKTVVTPPPEPADGVIAVAVVGEKTAELCILQGDAFLLTRSLQAASNLAADIRRSLGIHAGQMPQLPVRAVYLAGKGSGELRERLGEMLDIPVHTFDPFAGSEARELPGGNRGTFSGALGVLQSQSAGRLPINFVAPRQPKPPRNPNLPLMRAAAIGWLLLMAGLLGMGRLVYANRTAEAEDYEAQSRQTVSQLNRTREHAKMLKAIDDWDSLVWLDELYDLAARIPDLNSLRITHIQAEPLPRSAQSKFVARATIKGKLVGRGDPDRALKELMNQFGKEGYYMAEFPSLSKDQFTLVVSIERRSPKAYTRRLPGDKAPAMEPDRKGKTKDLDKGGKTKSKGTPGKSKRSDE